MPSEWHEMTLGEVCKFSAGSAFKTHYQGSVVGQYPFIKVSDMNLAGNETFIRYAQNFVSEEQRKELKAKLHPIGATVFAKIGVALTTNRRRLLTMPTIVDNNMMSATPLDGKVTSRFLYFLLTTLDFNTIAAGTALPYLNVSDLQKIPGLVPDMGTQREIELTLGALDDKIDLLRETNATLETIAQALFKSWFVDFDPVKAKAEGRDPEGVPPEVADLFPSVFEDSALGEIPKGWRVGKLGEISRNLRVGAKPEELTDDTAYIGLEHMPRQSIALDDWESASKVESGKSRFQKRQILFGKLRPYFHKVGIAPLDGVCSTDILVIEPSSPVWHAVCVCLFSSKALVEHATQLSNGAKMPRTNWADLANYRIVVPPDEVAQAFEEIVSPLLGSISENVHRAKTLAETRDALLPRLMSGKLRITGIQEAIEAAAA